MARHRGIDPRQEPGKAIVDEVGWRLLAKPLVSSS